MNIDGISAKARYGYGKAASKLGRTTIIYRPVSALSPIAPASILFTATVAFDTVPQFTFVNPQSFGQIKYYALMSATSAPYTLQPGDYLVSGATTYFVALVDDIAAPEVIRCDARVNVLRPNEVASYGPNYYSGGVYGNETPLLTGWPAGRALGGRAEANSAGLPGDTRAAGFDFYLPPSIPLQVRQSDVIEDEQAQPIRYTISGVEPGLLGYRIKTVQSVA